MKALISVDFEGLPYVVSSKYHLMPEGKLWNEARRIATRLTKVLCESLLSEGFDEVYVADSHGIMINLEPFELPDRTYVITGFPRPSPVMTPLIEGIDVALFLGYHGRATAESVLAHTYAGRYIHRIRVNNFEASEYLLNALVLGEKGVPVGLVAGSQELEDEVKRFTPNAVFIPLKHSLGYVSALSPSMAKVEQMLREGAKVMVERLRGGKLKPAKIGSDIVIEVVVANPLYADVAELMPQVERIDGVTIRFKASSMLDALKILELLLYAWVGAASITSR